MLASVPIIPHELNFPLRPAIQVIGQYQTSFKLEQLFIPKGAI